MGSFSWLLANKDTKVLNVAYGKPFKFLIPKEFGGGYILDKYQDYGYLGVKDDGFPKYDMNELLAFWNKEQISKNHVLLYDGIEIPKLKEIDEYTHLNRKIGIDIGCYDEEIDRLKYPLKLVSVSCNKTYEEISMPSYSDPNQGFSETRNVPF